MISRTARFSNDFSSKNPNVKFIWHPDDSRYPLDYDQLTDTAKEYEVENELTTVLDVSVLSYHFSLKYFRSSQHNQSRTHGNHCRTL